MGEREEFFSIFEIPCSCGCSYMKLELDKEDGTIYISHYMDTFHAKQLTILGILKRRIKMAWAALTGKEFYFFDLILTGKDAEDFLEKWEDFALSVKIINQMRKK